MFGFIVTFLGLSALILVHEAGHFAAAKWFGMRVDEFGIGFPPRIASFRRGETRYSVNSLPLGGFVRLYGELDDAGERSFVRYGVLPRAIVLVGGVFMNFVAGWLIFSTVFWIGSPAGVFVTDVMPGSPAMAAGVKPGDMIAGFVDPAAFSASIALRTAPTATFSIIRGGATIPIVASPRMDPPPGEGSLGLVLAADGAAAEGFLSGLSHGFIAAVSIAWAVVIGLGSLFSTPEAVVGPVGIFSIAIGAGHLGLAHVLQLLGVISLNLAVLNLLPIPALDGGRLVFMAIEVIRRKKFPAHAEMRAHAMGFALLLALIVSVTLKDVFALFS